MRLSRFEVVLLTIALFGSIIYFGFLSLTGRVYGGAASDNSYISFMMIVDVIPLWLFVRYLMTAGNKKNVFSICSVLIVFIISYGFGIGVENITFKSLLAFSTPSALVGILIAKSNRGADFAKLLEPIMLFYTVMGVVSMGHLLSVDSIRDVSEYGVGTQSLSYHSAFAFALNLYFLFFGDELSDRFKYTKSGVYKVISIILLLAQFVIGLSSGGRGGFVLLILSGVVLVFLRMVRHGENTLRQSLTFLLILISVIVAVQFMPENIVDAMNRGHERTFSYITGNGTIDMSETSNRDIVYKQCWTSISESPIIGHGLLMKGTPFFGERPHNIFFEILLQGGVIYLCVFIVFVIHLYKKMRILVRRGHGLYMVPVVLFPAVMLMFSGSYIETSLFWFVISYILCCDIPKIQQANGIVMNETVRTV